MIRIVLIAVFLFSVMSIGLLVLKSEVHQMEEELTQLHASIKSDRKTIRVLKAEWSHLNDPNRIRRLANTYLDLKPVAATQIASLAALPYSATETSPSRRSDQPAPAPRKPLFGLGAPEVASRGDD